MVLAVFATFFVHLGAMNQNSIKELILKNHYQPSNTEITLARLRFIRYYSLFRNRKLVDPSLPHLIKELSLQPSTHRFISSLFFKKTNPNHESQYSGRDLKRWAAIQLNELFEETALIKGHRLKCLNGDYWHE